MFTNDKTTQALAEKYLQMLESIKEKKKEASVEVEADDEAKTEVDVKSSGDSARNDDPAAKKTPGKEKKADKDDKKEMKEAKACKECGKSPCECEEEMDEASCGSKKMKESFAARSLAREEALKARLVEATGGRKLSEAELEAFANRLGMSVADVKKYLDEEDFSQAGDFKEEVELDEVIYDLMAEGWTEEEILDLSEEQLDELSKKTLGSYIKKASDDQADSGYERGRNSADSDRSKKAIDKYIKRRSGINKAVKRLTKEEVELDEVIYNLMVEGWTEEEIMDLSEEQLDELSKGLLKRYHDKSLDHSFELGDKHRNAMKTWHKTDDPEQAKKNYADAKKLGDQQKKRQAGYRMAHNKIHKNKDKLGFEKGAKVHATESAEQIDEISQATKASYLKKADKDSYDMFTGKKPGSKEKMDKRRAAIQKVSKELEGKKKLADYNPKTSKYER